MVAEQRHARQRGHGGFQELQGARPVAGLKRHETQQVQGVGMPRMTGENGAVAVLSFAQVALLVMAQSRLEGLFEASRRHGGFCKIRVGRMRCTSSAIGDPLN
jgi:hypothetical protein